MSLRLRLTLMLVLILGVGVFVVGRDLLNSFRKSNSEVAEAMMSEFARALASQIEIAGGVEKAPGQMAAIFAAYREKRGEKNPEGALEVYVTDGKGIVVFSSADPSEVGRDYSRWNDVYLALQGKYAARSTHRVANDPNTSIYYVAAPVRTAGRITGVVSVIKSEESVTPFLYNALRRALPVAVFALVLVGLFAVLVMVWITRPIHRLRDYALAVSRGGLVEKPVMGPRELRELMGAFETMRISLEGRRAIEDFVQGLVHELKSPLTAIQGSAELSLEKVADEQRVRFLRNILSEGARLQRLLEELLRLARLDSLVSLEKKERISLGELAKDACESMAAQKKCQIRIEGDGFVQGDELLLEQAIRNLLGNALQFSPPGGEIRVSVGASSGGVELVVRDQGPGVPLYARERIFEKFYSLERPDGTPRSSGLGLSFVRQVVQLHGGRVELLPGEGGAAFRIWLPA